MNYDLALADARVWVRMSLWASLITAGGWIAIPVGPVPITLQTFFIFLAAFREGPKVSLAVALYLLAGLMGLPVFANRVAGPAVLLGPTAGFLLCYLPAAAIAGLAVRKSLTTGKYLLRMLFFGLLANLLVYSGGVLGLHVNLGLDWKVAWAGVLIFIPGDIIKILAAATVVTGIKKSRRRT